MFLVSWKHQSLLSHIWKSWNWDHRPCVIPVSGAFHAATCLGRFAKTTMADETNGTNGEAGDVSLPEGWRKSGNMTY